MSLVIPDTCVLIEVFRDQRAADEVIERRWRFRHSAVVHSELLRGARTLPEVRFVKNLARTFTPIAPTAAHWERCGEALKRLQSRHAYDPKGLRAIQNDALIALTARDLGAPIVTTNYADFQLLAKMIGGVEVIRFSIGADRD